MISEVSNLLVLRYSAGWRDVLNGRQTMQAKEMAGHLIRRLHQHSTQVFAARTKEAGFEITPVQFAALDAINDHPGIDQAGVAERIAYDRATIGEVINRLVAKGLVERAVNDTDRRARVLRLTVNGVETFQALLPVVRDLQAAILANLSAKDRVAFLSLARSAVGNL